MKKTQEIVKEINLNFHKIINKDMLYVGDFIGSLDQNEYGLLTYSNEYWISFIDNVIGKIKIIFFMIH